MPETRRLKLNKPILLPVQVLSGLETHTDGKAREESWCSWMTLIPPWVTNTVLSHSNHLPEPTFSAVGHNPCVGARLTLSQGSPRTIGKQVFISQFKLRHFTILYASAMPLLGIDPKDSKSSNRNEVGWVKLDEKYADTAFSGFPGSRPPSSTASCHTSSGWEKLGEEPRLHSVEVQYKGTWALVTLPLCARERTLSQIHAESLHALNTGQQRSPAVADSSQRAAETCRK